MRLTRVGVMSIAAALLHCLVALTVRAEPGDLAREQARAEAFVALYSRIESLQLTPDTRVSKFLSAGADLRALAYHALRKSVHETPYQTYSDGTVAIQVSLPLGDLVRHLSEVCTAHYSGDKFQPKDFEKILLYTDREGVWGFGSSRGEPPVGIAAGAPVGWYDVGVFGRLRARHDASENAYRQLTERIRHLRMSPTREVSAFLDSNPRIASDVGVYVRSRPISGTARYTPERICEVEVTQEVAPLVAFLKSLANAYAEGTEFTADAISDIALQAGESKMTVTGVAVPPTLPEGIAAEEVVTQKADAEPPEAVDDAQQARLLAVRAALAEAREALRKQILAEAGPTGKPLAEWLAREPSFRTDVGLLLENLRLVQIRNQSPSRVEAVAELPVGRLRELIRHYERKLAEPAGPESSTPATAN